MILHLHFSALHGLEHLLRFEVFAVDSCPLHHMVLEHGIQLLDVLWLQKPLERRRVEFGKRLVCWSKDCERTLALERGNELAGGDGSDECGEVFVALSEGNDVFGWLWRHRGLR